MRKGFRAIIDESEWHLGDDQDARHGGNTRRRHVDPQQRVIGSLREVLRDTTKRRDTARRHPLLADAQKKLDRVLLELQPGDPRIAQAHFFLGEAHYATGSHLEAAREFRKTSDDTPNDPLAADALLRVGDVYADLWRRPELDPSYGQTALATYQELVNRYPGTNAASRAQARIADLQERFAYKEYRAALYYFKLKAYDSAILYLKDVVATYPRAAIAPEALVKLVQAYQKLGYKEDMHPDAAKSHGVCPPDSTGAS